jgi:hypothetical protein
MVGANGDSGMVMVGRGPIGGALNLPAVRVLFGNDTFDDFAHTRAEGVLSQG